MKYEVQPNPDADSRLFVYGTLRKGFRSHDLLRRFHARLMGRGSVRGRLYDLGEYPGAVASAVNAERVFGELYILPQAEAAFRVLDKFEGFDPEKPEVNEFERRETTVTLDGGCEVRAWAYWLSHGHAAGRRIQEGNYAMPRD